MVVPGRLALHNLTFRGILNWAAWLNGLTLIKENVLHDKNKSVDLCYLKKMYFFPRAQCALAYGNELSSIALR